VVGAGGQVGGALLARLRGRALGTWRRPPHGGLALDLEEAADRPGAAAAVIEQAQATVVCIAAGMTHVDGCEDDPRRARRVNRDGPAALAHATRRAGAQTVYLSSEYVFDGTAGPYIEGDEVNPMSAYGRSKWEGEQAVLEYDASALVVRTTVVYGPESHGRNTAYQLAARLRAGQVFRAPADQVTTPTYNTDLAEALVALVASATSGIVHVAGPDVIDRASFARRLAAAMGLDPHLVEAATTGQLAQRAPRPLRGGLALDRLRSLLPDLPLRSVEAAVTDWDRRVATPPWR
jgi:dTDP-4-dehydrorhamnose reductase